MPDLPTRADLFNVGAEEIEIRSQGRSASRRVSPEEVFTDGSDVNLITSSASTMADEIVALLADRIGALFLDSAEAEDLDRLVADRFSPTVVRNEAVASVGFVQLTRTVTATAETVPTGTIIATEDGVEVETVLDATFSIGQAGPVSVRVQARQVGTQGNVLAGLLTEIRNPPAWASAQGLTVTNDEPMTGGADTETDASLRARARDFFRVARRGTLEAIEFGALTVSGVVQATAVEELDAAGDQTGRVSLYIADSQGQANAALVTDVRTALREYRAAGIFVDVLGSTPEYVSIDLRLRYLSTVDSTIAFGKVRTAVVAAVATLKPRETLELSLIIEACRSVTGVVVLDDAIVSPVGDVIPTGNQVLRTAPELIQPVT